MQRATLQIFIIQDFFSFIYLPHESLVFMALCGSQTRPHVVSLVTHFSVQLEATDFLFFWIMPVLSQTLPIV